MDQEFVINALRNMSAAPYPERTMFDAIQKFRELVPLLLADYVKAQGDVILIRSELTETMLSLQARGDEVDRLRGWLRHIKDYDVYEEASEAVDNRKPLVSAATAALIGRRSPLP